MRHPILLALVLVVACSSADPGVTPPPAPPPPPPGGSVPSVLAIQAGDGQQAEPGTVVTVKPMVAVKDGAGLGVAGVTVTFSVDSGGGTLQATSAVTGVNGTAGPGDWHLGTTEGRNVMSATVTSLSKIKFVATAAIGTVTLSEQTVGSAGKTFTITSGALAGTALVISSGAFSQNASWKLEQRSNATWPRRAGVNPVGASLHITSGNTSLATSKILLTLPATVPAGSRPFVLMRSPATNAIEVLQTVTVDPGTITVALQHFDPGWIAQRGQGLPGLRAYTRSSAAPSLNYDAEVVVSAIPEADLDGDIDTGFRPGTDDWDIEPMLTSIVTSGPVSADIETGIVLTEMAYFAYLKPTTGSLFKKYREIPELPLTNRVGYHVAAYNGFLAPGDRIFDFLNAIRSSMRAGQADQRFYDVLKANLIVSGLPQFMSAHILSGSYPLVAYRVIGGRVDMVNPKTPGVGTSVQFAGGQFGPVNIVYNDVGGTHLAEWIGMVPVGQILKMPLQAQDISKIAAGLPASEIDEWPTAKLNARGGFVDDTIMYAVDDTTRFWVECATCHTGMASTLPPGRVEAFAGYYRTAAGAPEHYAGTDGSGYLINQTTATDTRVGFVKLEGAAGGVPSWLDFQWIRLKKWVMTLPADLTAATGTPKTFTTTIDGTALMPAHQFVWTFGAGATAVIVTSTGPSVTTTLTQEGTLPIKIELKRTSDSKVIAVGKGTVTVSPPLPIWKFTTMAVTVTKVGALNLASGRFRVDSQKYARMSEGGAQGAIYVLDEPLTRVCDVCGPRTLLQGFYVLEGASITASNFNAVPPFISTVSADLPGLAAAPTIKGWPLLTNPLFAHGTPCDREGDPGEFYQRTGSLTNGRIVGKMVSNCTGGFEVPQIDGHLYPTVTMAVDVTFSGNLATGTITGTYLTVHGPPNIDRVTVTVTFQATRLTP